MKKLVLSLIAVFGLLNGKMNAQSNMENYKSVAIISVDATGIDLDNVAMANLIRFELEKAQKYEVLDKYDVETKMKERQINPNEAFGKSALIDVGRKIGADYMLTGSVQKYGSKIIFILRLVDVQNGRISKSDVQEYIYDEQYLQLMARVSLISLLDLPMDEDLKAKQAKLTNVETPVISDGQTLRLNGPRFGMQLFTGDVASRLMAPESEGGYASNPFSTVFAYQHEIQYVSSGKFQALLEIIPAINAIETKYASPSLTLLNGFRYNGWELGFGPVFRFNRTAVGYFDNQGSWNMGPIAEEDANLGYETQVNIDKRGDLGLSAGLIVAVGKTFRSGHLNFPVNIYYSGVPTYDSQVFGIMLGFNIAKSRR